jgi:hypothetical protein
VVIKQNGLDEVYISGGKAQFAAKVGETTKLTLGNIISTSGTISYDLSIELADLYT